ncbi:periplasmic binding protein-like I [Choanephora cucurbitarum]|nr:periplasmic binding protein-like I [Choanephora cucurbitarum]
MLIVLFYCVICISFLQTITVDAQRNVSTTPIKAPPTTTVATNPQPTTHKPVYNIGLMFPRASDVSINDTTLSDIIITSEVAIQLATRSIKNKNILNDVELNFTRYYSDENNPGKTSLAAVKMIQDNVNAVIGDIVSGMTEAIASITGVEQIPQCSFASGSYDLTDKKIYPYFFRTIGSVILYGESLVDWVDSMGWNMFAIIYTNDAVGQQMLRAVKNQANKRSINVMTNIPLYSITNEEIEDSLSQLESSGSRVVVLADSDTSHQIAILTKAREMGLLEKGWAWIVTNDISPVLQSIAKSPEELALYDGLMFISGLWELTGVPEYDALNQIWKNQRVPSEFSNSKEWNTTGLSYNAPQAYACAELLALGLDKALNLYPGGRAAGLSDLNNGVFNSSNMTPTFYNLNHTGPAGYMDFSETGDLKSGYFQLLYMLNGTSVPYATVKLNVFEFIPNTSVIYLGHTTDKPSQMLERSALNPTLKNITGIIILTVCVFGFSFTLLMFILIFLFRDLKPIMVSSPIFCYLQLTGIACTYVAVSLYLGIPNPAKCIMRQILLLNGFVLVIGSIVARNYRIYRIFQNVFTVKTSKLKSYFLVRIVAAFAAIGLLPLITWYAIYPIVVSDVMVSSSAYCWVCTYPTAGIGDWQNVTVVESIALVWCAILIVISAFLAFKTRNVGSKWSEATQIAYVSYNTGLAAMVATPNFFLSLEDYAIRTYLKIGSILFAATFTILVLFLPKFVLIMRHIMKSNKNISLYRMNTDSQAQLTGFSSYNSTDENFNLNYVAKNLFDFTVQAHEGILPVKKMARYKFLSIWELKHVVLVPLKQFFILSGKSGQKTHLYHYISCEVVKPDSIQHHMFRVRTKEGLTFLFQVSDETALNRWLGWFNGRGNVPLGAPQRQNTQARFANQEAKAEDCGSDTVGSSVQSMEPAHHKNQLETFGMGAGVASILNHPTFFHHTSDFYDPNSFTDANNRILDMSDHSPSNQSSNYHTTSSFPNDQLMAHDASANIPNSFGIIDPSWR